MIAKAVGSGLRFPFRVALLLVIVVVHTVNTYIIVTRSTYVNIYNYIRLQLCPLAHTRTDKDMQQMLWGHCVCPVTRILHNISFYLVLSLSDLRGMQHFENLHIHTYVYIA